MQASYSGSNRSVKYLFENATEVSVDQILTSGTPIATITVDGDDVDLYAPAGGGSDVVANPVGTPTDDLDTIEIDGVIYDIPGSGGGSVMMSDYYSTDERVVGRWTDGKPLYQKTYIFSSSIVINNQGVSIASYIDNLSEYDMVVDAIGYGIGSSSTWCDRIYLDSTGRAWCAEGMTAHRATIQYTKTTDTAGTGPTPGNLIYLPALYSEEEREVGVWTDGKPLYQKTLHIVESTEQTEKTYTTEITSLGADHIQLMHAEIKLGSSGNNEIYSQPFWYNNAYNELVAVSNTYMNIYSRGWNWKEAYVTLQYTKTTDQPGSGTWTPEGQLAHHYSTSEKIVGTWIDGSTVYERTWDFGSDITVSASSWYDTSILQGNMNRIIKYIAMDSDGTNRALDVALDGYVQLLSMRNSGNDVIRYITLQYTKSS